MRNVERETWNVKREARGTMHETQYDIIIVGGGPAGLYALFYAYMREMKALLIESNSELGGQLTAIYPEKYIYDVAGFPKILAKDLVKNLIEQLKPYNPEINLNETLEDIKVMGDKKIYIKTNRKTYLTKTILLCIGVGAFTPRRLEVPGVTKYINKGVYYMVKEKSIFTDKNVLVIGGGDSAVDWALELEPIAKHVTLIHRREGFRAHESSVKKLFESKVTVMTFYELKEIHGDEQPREAVIFDNRSNVECTIPVDAVLINIGYIANLGNVERWNLAMNGRFIIVDPTMRTNLPGVYAAGDIISYPGHIHLISVCFSESAIAVNNAKNYIDPQAKISPKHSSQ